MITARRELLCQTFVSILSPEPFPHNALFMHEQEYAERPGDVYLPILSATCELITGCVKPSLSAPEV
jgi:hypothetical protein